MTTVSKDQGVAISLAERLTKDTLPKAFEIKARLDRGERLEHWDIEFLKELFKHAEQVKPLVDRNPEFQEVYAQVVQLYKEITERALINEKDSTAHG